MATLPEKIVQRIEEWIHKFSYSALEKGLESLSRKYLGLESVSSNSYMQTPEEKAAYLIFRLPATYSAVKTVFEEVNKLAIFPPVKRIIDLGSGPGTSLIAALEVFPALEHGLAVEKDSTLIDMAQYLLFPLGRGGQYQDKMAVGSPTLAWTQVDLSSLLKNQNLWSESDCDMIVASYSIGELQQQAQLQLLEHCAHLPCKAFACIEPGTPDGFATIMRMRHFFLSKGWQVIAPCTHCLNCPMKEKDWCHFYTRLERTSLQRRLKKGTLGWEDEKFSYLVVAPSVEEKVGSFPEGRARIVRHPCVRSGHVHLTLCSSQGLSHPVVSRKWGDGYFQAKQSHWGDIWDLSLIKMKGERG